MAPVPFNVLSPTVHVNGEVMASTHTKQPFSLRIHPGLKEAIEEAARRDNRTVTSLVEKLMIDYCRGVGIAVKSAQNEQK